jgi:hypothetical protein
MATGGGGWGGAIGAIVGAGTSMAEMNAQKKARERAEGTAEFGGVRPKRRNIARLQRMIAESFNNKQRALIAMAQAHQNFASMW